MSTKGRGAFVRNFKQPLHFEGVDFSDPSPGEMLVQMRTSGVCHTDVHAVDGDWPIKFHLPFIPGHEGVGIAAKVGCDVRNLKKGDRVGLPWLRAACGHVNGVLPNGKPCAPMRSTAVTRPMAALPIMLWRRPPTWRVFPTAYRILTQVRFFVRESPPGRR